MNTSHLRLGYILFLLFLSHQPNKICKMCFQKQAIDSLQNNQTFNIATLYSSMKYYWPYIYFEFYQLKK